MSLNDKSKTAFLDKEKVRDHCLWIFNRSTSERREMTLEDLRYKKEKWTKELLNLNANLNTYCKIYIYNSNVKILTVFNLGKGVNSKKITKILLLVIGSQERSDRINVIEGLVIFRKGMKILTLDFIPYTWWNFTYNHWKNKNRIV